MFNALNNTDPKAFSDKDFLFVFVNMDDVVNFRFFNISVLKLNFKVVLLKFDLPAPTIPYWSR